RRSPARVAAAHHTVPSSAPRPAAGPGRPARDPPGELPAHRPGARGGPGAPRAGRDVRDVQLLRALRSQPVRNDDRGRISPGSVRAARRDRPGPADGRPDRPAGGARGRRGPLLGRRHGGPPPPRPPPPPPPPPAPPPPPPP